MEERVQTLQSWQRTKFSASAKFDSSKVYGIHALLSSYFWETYFLLRKCSTTVWDSTGQALTPSDFCPQRDKGNRLRERDSLVDGAVREAFRRMGAWTGSGGEGHWPGRTFRAWEGKEITSWNSTEVPSIGREQAQTLNTVPYVISLSIEREALPALYPFLQSICKESEHSGTCWQSEYHYYHHWW